VPLAEGERLRCLHSRSRFASQLQSIERSVDRDATLGVARTQGGSGLADEPRVAAPLSRCFNAAILRVFGWLVLRSGRPFAICARVARAAVKGDARWMDRTHRAGGTESLGYGPPFSIFECERRLLARSGRSSSMRSTWFTEPSSGDQSSGTSSEARFISRASDRERTSKGRRNIAAILATSFHAHIASRRFRRSSFRSSATDAYATP
jgi:hypothetical protein